ncbi:hypothetical protein JW859_03590 [bacterium]|nr:hypothetical protein [bacterium]
MGNRVVSSIFRLAWLCLAACFLLGLAGCPGQIDSKVIYGMEPPDDLPPDDKLSSKNPEYVDYMVGLRNIDGRLLYFNGSDSVIGLDLVEPEGERESEQLDRLYPNLEELVKAADDAGTLLPSIDLLDRYTKTTDDAAYGAIELAYHDGDPVNSGGKQQLLNDILAALKELPDASARELAIAFIAAAIKLGGGDPDPGPAARKMAAIEKRFLADKFFSKPVGFYVEDETLKKVFQRDRLLQQPFGWGNEKFTNTSPDIELGAMALIATVLADNPELLAAYDKYQRTAERLTNPTSNLDLRDLLPYRELFDDPTALRNAMMNSEAWQVKIVQRHCSSNLGVAFWPFSYSRENVLFRDLPDDPMDDINLMDLFTAAIRAGSLDLAPAADSGWYDYQAYALETLLLPERGLEYNNLLMSGKYKQRLKKAFEALITQRRETHIKQLECCDGAAAPCEPPCPRLRIEPAITHFLRTARGYAMLVDALGDVLGDEAFAGIELADGSGTVADSLRESCTLFYGLHLLSCIDIGIPCGLDPGELVFLTNLEPPAELTAELLWQYPVAADPALDEMDALAMIACCQLAEEWLDELWDGGFLAADPRVIVPVYRNDNLRCWAVVGVKLVKLEATYEREPRTLPVNRVDEELSLAEARQQLADGDNRGMWWGPLEKLMPVYVFAEVEIGPEPLTREEFRAICDKGDTREEIVKLLEKLQR